MPEEPRTPWLWTPRRAALAVTGAMVTAAWVAVGATMMLADNAAPSTATSVRATPSAPASPAPAKPAAKPNRSHARYNPKPYKGPLPKRVLRAPVAVAHPPQVSNAPAGSEDPDAGESGGHQHRR